ncbi:MAG: nucleotidyltransferase domain-containing protein [Alphaproteobacteria bacterium]|nr:nucleotidyltransferase domain-containing protein [Alphaproteobacteria bacterium]MBF0355092.1 nucleotidyltransferase domain-containing protein [Alphaproteobacteria bacterium]
MARTLEDIIARLKTEEPGLRKLGICHLALFGSVVRGEERPDSDIDIAVDIEEGKSFSLFRMEDTRLRLEGALGRSVDLGEVGSFKPQIRAAFERERVLVF